MNRMVKVIGAVALVTAMGCAPKAETPEQADQRMAAEATAARTAMEASNQQFMAFFNAGQSIRQGTHSKSPNCSSMTGAFAAPRTCGGSAPGLPAPN